MSEPKRRIILRVDLDHYDLIMLAARNASKLLVGGKARIAMDEAITGFMQAHDRAINEWVNDNDANY